MASSPELLEFVEELQNLLISEATGGAADAARYRVLRDGLVGDPRTAAKLPRFVRTCRDLHQFWQFIKHKFGDLSDVERANNLVIPWVAAVMRQRLSPTGGGLREVSDGTAWLGNIQTGEVASSVAFSGRKELASWLPDEASARGWQLVFGATRK